MTRRYRILLVDDDQDLLRLTGIRLEAAGYEVDTADSGEAALRQDASHRPDLVISDLKMAGMDGMRLLDELQRRRPGMPVLLITAHGTIPDAVSATQRGAVGFLTKPVDKDELLSMAQQALQSGAPPDRESDGLEEGIVYRSDIMRELMEMTRKVAATDSSVMIRGASGSGKELIAHALHRASGRHQEPFVALNCAAIPEALLEAELFGYERGSFTGASRSHPGLLNNADGGTLFLDEVGDMPVNLQTKLLRVLQDRRVRRIGSLQDTPVDVRIVSATHADLETGIVDGSFREDLYYRLNVITLKVPSLADRREDIPLIVNHFLDGLSNRQGGTRKVFAPEAIELLVSADWPGNVRQLFNVVEQTVVLAPGPVISAAQVAKALGTTASTLPSFDEARDEFTHQYLVQLLQVTGGNVSRAARLAQRNRTDFYKLLKRHGIEPDSFKQH